MKKFSKNCKHCKTTDVVVHIPGDFTWCANCGTFTLMKTGESWVPVKGKTK